MKNPIYMMCKVALKINQMKPKSK